MLPFVSDTIYDFMILYIHIYMFVFYVYTELHTRCREANYDFILSQLSMFKVYKVFLS